MSLTETLTSGMKLVSQWLPIRSDRLRGDRSIRSTDPMQILTQVQHLRAILQQGADSWQYGRFDDARTGFANYLDDIRAWVNGEDGSYSLAQLQESACTYWQDRLKDLSCGPVEEPYWFEAALDLLEQVEDLRMVQVA